MQAVYDKMETLAPAHVVEWIHQRLNDIESLEGDKNNVANECRLFLLRRNPDKAEVLSTENVEEEDIHTNAPQLTATWKDVLAVAFHLNNGCVLVREPQPQSCLAAQETIDVIVHDHDHDDDVNSNNSTSGQKMESKVSQEQTGIEEGDCVCSIVGEQDENAAENTDILADAVTMSEIETMVSQMCKDDN